MANIAKESLLTQEYVKELFDYKDGFLYWKISRTAAVKVGMLAGTVNHGKQGNRRKIGVAPFSKKLYASRVIYLWHHGWLPDFIDHEDNNPENNLIGNLRPATRQQNSYNCSKVKGSSSRFLGVAFHKMTGKWQAKASMNGRPKYLGLYISEIDAAIAYNKHAKEYYGEFANINNV